jgi:hypothetical protein
MTDLRKPEEQRSCFDTKDAHTGWGGGAGESFVCCGGQSVYGEVNLTIRRVKI